MQRSLFLLALLGLTGCLGIEFGNPDQNKGDKGGRGGDDEVPGWSDLSSSPSFLALERTCPGGTRRTSVILSNDAVWDVDATAGGQQGEEAYPSAFEVDARGQMELVVVIPIPADAVGEAKGKVEVLHRREGVRPEDYPDMRLEIPWSAEVGAPAARATLLCGREDACGLVEFGEIRVGTSWQAPIEVANDGCAPLRIERVVAEGGAEVVGPGLPLTLQPGERWTGRLVFTPEATGELLGSVVVESDDPHHRTISIPWSAYVVEG